ncbi:MAG: hypothetical protein WCC48_18135 [Anaeromyxobacteraceae bacterium]
MSPRTVLLVCGPLAAIGLAAAVNGTLRVAHARRELSALAETSAFEGRAFAETLRGAHAERQLEALTARRVLARELSTARRDRLLGVILLAGSVLTWLGLRAFARMADEIEHDRRHLAGAAKVD